jgi:oligopeptide transport system ATP-binding protein
MEPVLSIEHLRVGYAQRAATLEAVQEVSLAVASGEALGVVGESGSGKSQVFLAAMGLLSPRAVVGGSIRFAGSELLGAPAASLNRVRGSKLTMIFQDPMSSLTPHLRIGVQLAEVLVRHAGLSWRDAWSQAGLMLERVRVPEHQRRLRQYPHELSGGMRQRVMIGMSLLCEPLLLIADEPTSALDAVVQAQIIDLLRTIRAETRMALVLISHDFSVVADLADKILVMYAGRVMECAQAAQLLAHPRHPYTAELLKCVPTLSGPRLERLPTLAGQPPRSGDDAPGCAFATRCPRAAQRCRSERPPLAGDASSQFACHFPLSS